MTQGWDCTLALILEKQHRSSLSISDLSDPSLGVSAHGQDVVMFTQMWTEDGRKSNSVTRKDAGAVHL